VGWVVSVACVQLSVVWGWLGFWLGDCGLYRGVIGKKKMIGGTYGGREVVCVYGFSKGHACMVFGCVVRLGYTVDITLGE